MRASWPKETRPAEQPNANEPTTATTIGLGGHQIQEESSSWAALCCLGATARLILNKTEPETEKIRRQRDTLTLTSANQASRIEQASIFSQVERATNLHV